MARYLIIAQSQYTATALRTWTELLGNEPIKHDTLIVDGEKLCVFERGLEFIAQAVRESERVTVLVDSIDLSKLNPCASPGGWDAAIAMLILALPEVRWVFGTFTGGCDHMEESQGLEHNGTTSRLLNCECERQRRLHGLASLLQEQFEPLFDATGLRQWVKTRAAIERTSLLDYANRTRLACALDDEEPFASFHAYTAYRFGFTAIPVTREKLANSLFAKGGRWRNLGLTDRLGLSFEDFFLNYPDRSADIGWSDLKKRAEDLPGLTGQLESDSNARTLRVFVTAGEHRGAQSENLNCGHLQSLQQKGLLGSLVHKPTGGSFGLWEKSGLARKFRRNRGYAPEFKLPGHSHRKTPSDGHGAPGALLLIAQTLIDRSDTAPESVRSVKQAVRGAVLASDALELLGGKTPTTALEALARKHQFEMLAECQFPGVEHHIPLNGRLDEIKRDVKAICRWFGAKQQRLARINAEMDILTKLVRVFRQFGQFDEEQKCINRVRHLHNTLLMRTRSWGAGFLLWPLLRYSEFLLASLTRFQIAFVGWIAFLTGSFYAIEKWGLARPPANDDFHPLSIAISTFFGVEPFASHHPLWIGLTIFAVLGGIAHLAIFISHLYVLVSRR